MVWWLGKSLSQQFYQLCPAAPPRPLLGSHACKAVVVTVVSRTYLLNTDCWFIIMLCELNIMISACLAQGCGALWLLLYLVAIINPFSSQIIVSSTMWSHITETRILLHIEIPVGSVKYVMWTFSFDPTETVLQVLHLGQDWQFVVHLLFCIIPVKCDSTF